MSSTAAKTQQSTRDGHLPLQGFTVASLWPWNHRTSTAKLSLITSLLLTTSACDRTPVEIIICDANGKDCFVHARFRDLPDCESVKGFMEANCDSVSHALCGSRHAR